ncbi:MULTISPECIES: DUF1223 domain-containing protein [Methylobacterium]|uniref:DUF1223 domain-containing protein n=1 Tax=Methylobacterium thuringiense TaxID=1003091 RepID=A0ABQ4TMM3_9HYPH|nr:MULTISPECIES: DUF1223 domain-containing protein [Methylobacterium]TXN22095.1 DUF1223 domain-containing protein [Methylobacterium sp. WL9]GJE56635.1 hypothetical protein EKPJFOCH_3143 [Methylobacterium thuringiense]
MRILLLAAALLAAPLAEAAERPVVVELFTSQGCSSCPPADAYLTDLAARRDVLPLAFHVTYWNRLGWRDPYSLTAATARQEAYAGRLGETAFTPQMVVDGRSSVIGSRRGEAGAAIAQAKAQAVTGVPVSLSRGGAGLSIAVGPGAGAGRVLLVGFDRRRTTPVGRGENSGRTLTESNIVRSIREVATWRGAPLSLGEGVPAGEDAAVIVQADDGRILGAARL